MEQDGESTSGASPGVGAVPNCHYPLVNLEVMSTNYDTAGLHRSLDPGVGGFSPYYGKI